MKTNELSHRLSIADMQVLLASAKKRRFESIPNFSCLDEMEREIEGGAEYQLHVRGLGKNSSGDEHVRCVVSRDGRLLSSLDSSFSTLRLVCGWDKPRITRFLAAKTELIDRGSRPQLKSVTGC